MEKQEAIKQTVQFKMKFLGVYKNPMLDSYKLNFENLSPTFIKNNPMISLPPQGGGII
jgi:hypothetical protein